MTTLKAFGSSPAWGPARIAYVGEGGATTIARDGSGTTVVAKSDDGIPAWSSAGRLALLERDNGRLAIRFPAGGTQILLPGLRPPIEGPPGLAWSPDGTRLAFTAVDAQGFPDVWAVGADGSGLARVTHRLGADNGVAWR